MKESPYKENIIQKAQNFQNWLEAVFWAAYIGKKYCRFGIFFQILKENIRWMRYIFKDFEIYWECM